MNEDFDVTSPEPSHTAKHWLIGTIAAAAITALGVLGAAWINNDDEAEGAAPTTTQVVPPPPVISCSIDFGSADVGAPINASCLSGVASFAANPDNGTLRTNGDPSWWPGMVSGWTGVPDGWTITAKVRLDGETVLEQWTGPTGGYSPTSPKNDRVVGLEITAPSAGSFVVKSCFDPCNEMEASESLLIELQP